MDPDVAGGSDSPRAITTLITVFDDIYQMLLDSPLASIASVSAVMSGWLLFREFRKNKSKQ